VDLVVVPAGGGSRRLGRDKLAVEVGGATVLDRLLEGLAAQLPDVPVVVVGPERPTRRRVAWAREDPPGGGPAAALASALADGPTSGLVLVVAGDLPFGADAVPALRAAEREDTAADAWVAVDGAGVVQPLLGLYRAAALRVALRADATGGPAGRSVRGLLSGMRVAPVAVPARATLDVDTEDDLRAVRAAADEPPS
jgi:molybdenum cofactor guanylyltransferase